MKVTFARDGSPVGTAAWVDDAVHIEAEGEARDLLARIFRASPVAADDPSGRPAGASGPLVLQHGDRAWFLAAARVRGEEEGLEVRFSSDAPGGWDPAGSYVRLGERIGQPERPASPAG